MLRGHATARMDDKGRLKIPAEFLGLFLELCGPNRDIYTTSRDGKMVLVYPLPVWEEYEKRIADAPQMHPAVENYVRALMYWGHQSQIDGAGRVLVHPLLRNHARLTSEACVFGKQNLLEICDHETYKGAPPVVTRDDQALLSQFGL